MPRPLRFLSTLAISLVIFAGSAVAASRDKAPAQTRAPDTRAAAPRVSTLRVTVLSTQLADAGLGEWGFAALVEADGHRILFDTGAHPDTVLKNVQELGIDLSDIEDVVRQSMPPSVGSTCSSSMTRI